MHLRRQKPSTPARSSSAAGRRKYDAAAAASHRLHVTHAGLTDTDPGTAELFHALGRDRVVALQCPGR